MNISLKLAGAFTLGALILGLSLGRFAAPSKVRVETRTIHDLVDHSVIVRTQEQKPDGTIVTSIVTKKDVQTENSSVSSKEITREHAKWLVSGIMGIEIGSGHPLSPVYGAALQHRLMGPFFIGAQTIMLGNGMFAGASLGMEL